MLLNPQSSRAIWQDGVGKAPALEYFFQSYGVDAEALIDFLPTIHMYTGMKLRVAVSVDQLKSALLEVPETIDEEKENRPIRGSAVQDNCVRLHVPLPNPAEGKHPLTIRAVDPGVIIDRVSLPQGLSMKTEPGDSLVHQRMPWSYV